MLASYEVEERDILDRLAERDAALVRARWTSLLGTAGIIGVLAALARTQRKSP